MFAPRALVHQDSQRSHRHQTHANEQLVRIQRMKQLFHGTALPLPTVEVEAAWKEVPNQVLPMSLETRSVSLEAPPQTPTQDVIVKDDSPCRESTIYNRSKYYDPLRHEGIGPPMDDAGLNPNEEKSENSLRPAPSVRSHASTHQGHPSRRELGPLVAKWMSDYHERGREHFVDALVTSGIESRDSVSLVSRVAHFIIKELRRTSEPEGDSLRSTIRFSVLAVFKKHWEPNGAWRLDGASSSTDNAPLTLRGMSIAGLIGALFAAEVLSAKDIHLCLSMLLEGNKHIDRLRAMHALLNHANDKLCKKRNRDTLIEFRDSITAKSESGEYAWASTPNSTAVIDDILATIQRWMALQARKREVH